MERTNGFHSGYRAKSMSTLQTRSADTGISTDVAIACRIYGRSTQPSDLHSWHRIFPVPCLILPVPSHRTQSMLALDRTGKPPLGQWKRAVLARRLRERLAALAVRNALDERTNHHCHGVLHGRV